MTVLVDTGVLYADHDNDASRHEAASEALEVIYDGNYGQPFVSEYIYDEAVTLTLKRTGSSSDATTLGKRLRGSDPFPRAFEMLHVSSAIFTDAVTVFEEYDDHGLSFTDTVTVALCRRHDMDSVLSFDDDFDGIVTRLDPSQA